MTTFSTESNLAEFEDYLPFIDLKKDISQALDLADDSCARVTVPAVPIGLSKTTQIWVSTN